MAFLCVSAFGQVSESQVRDSNENILIRRIKGYTTSPITGAWTFSTAPTFSTMTLGSIFFAGTGGLLSQDNAHLFWDNPVDTLKILANGPHQIGNGSGSGWD